MKAHCEGAGLHSRSPEGAGTSGSEGSGEAKLWSQEGDPSASRAQACLLWPWKAPAEDERVASLGNEGASLPNSPSPSKPVCGVSGFSSRLERGQGWEFTGDLGDQNRHLPASPGDEEASLTRPGLDSSLSPKAQKPFAPSGTVHCFSSL